MLAAILQNATSAYTESFLSLSVIFTLFISRRDEMQWTGRFMHAYTKPAVTYEDSRRNILKLPLHTRSHTWAAPARQSLHKYARVATFFNNPFRNLFITPKRPVNGLRRNKSHKSNLRSMPRACTIENVRYVSLGA